MIQTKKVIKTTFQKYPRYKDSGVDWLGEVPEGWDVKPLFSEVKLRSEDNHIDEELLSVYLDKGVIRFKDVVAKRTNVTSTDLSKYQLVEIGDFVLNNQQAWRGSVGVSSFHGIVSPAYLVLQLSKRLDKIFANYMFRNQHMVTQYLKSSKGVGTIQRNLYYPQLKRANVLIPPLPEQTAIANFLDEKTNKIDQAIAQKERMIALLKERKQIIIQNAVTKGLEPNVKMKDSGVKWIGEIPEHWEVLTLKRMVSTGIIEFQDGNHGGDYPRENEFSDVGVPFIKPRDMQDGEILFETSDKLSLERSLKLRIGFAKKNDILMVNRGGSIGKVCFAKANYKGLDFFIINPQVTYLRANKGLDCHYLYNLCQSEIFQTGVDMILGYGSTFSFLGLGNMGKFPIPIPPTREQLEIVRYIEIQSSKIDQAISLQKIQIEKLKEYKATLIDSAVTGKIKVC